MSRPALDSGGLNNTMSAPTEKTIEVKELQNCKQRSTFCTLHCKIKQYIYNVIAFFLKKIKTFRKKYQFILMAASLLSSSREHHHQHHFEKEREREKDLVALRQLFSARKEEEKERRGHSLVQQQQHYSTW